MSLMMALRCPECANKVFSEFVQGIAFWTEENDEELRSKLQQHGFSKGHTTTNWKHINKMKTECWSADWGIQFASHEPKFLMPIKTRHADDAAVPAFQLVPASSSSGADEQATSSGADEQATRQILFRILNNQMKTNFTLISLQEKMKELGDHVEAMRANIGRSAPPSAPPTAPPPTRLTRRRRSRSPLKLLTPKTESGV